jgi:hypothetical protein
MTMFAARHIHHQPRLDAAQRVPGELVTVRLAPSGTWGRAVLVARTPRGWLALRCTTRRRTSAGTARPAVPNPAAVGLHQPGWLCVLPIEIADHDLGLHIGVVDHALTDVITSRCQITPAHAASLHRAVAHHAVRTHLANIPGADR